MDSIRTPKLVLELLAAVVQLVAVLVPEERPAPDYFVVVDLVA
jgi:hypothetical protein